MRSSKFIKGCTLGCTVFGLIALATSGARAASLTVSGWTLGEQVNVASSSVNGWVNTAELAVKFDGKAGSSFCVDLAQSIGSGTTTGWEARSVDGNDALIRAAWLIDRFQPAFADLLAPGVTQQTLIAALQVSIWEGMADAPGQYDLYNGDFALVSGGASQGVMNLARGFLGELGSADLGSFKTGATWAYSATRQDQLVSSPIPEPNSLLLFAAGASLIAFVARQKRA